MNKKYIRLLLLPLLLGSIFTVSSCNPSLSSSSSEVQNSSSESQFVDYASELKLDTTTSRARTEATVKLHIDGDTVHFSVPNGVGIDGVLKARFLGVDTPESTGKVQPWGKTASNYTKEKNFLSRKVIYFFHKLGE